MKAILHGIILANSDKTIEIEGNHYFPPESLTKGLLKESDTETVCVFKGNASYYNADIDGDVHTDIGRYYADPKEEYKHIAGYVAFYPHVDFEK